MATLARSERKINKFGDSHRYYRVPDGRELPSVTTVLGVIGKPGLLPWAAKVEREMVLAAVSDIYERGVLDATLRSVPCANDFLANVEHALGKERAHAKELKKAADIGSDAHKWIEWSLCRELLLPAGPEPTLSAPALIATGAWKLWRESVDFKPLAVESMLYSKVHGYAGTMDFLAEMTHEGERITVLGDIKTGSAIYQEAKMQTAAYVTAAVEMGVLGAPVPSLIVRLPKKGPGDGFETALTTVADNTKYFQAFLAALSLFNALEGLK